MNAMRIQGVVFSVVAFVVAVAAAATVRFDPQVELVVVGVLILILGVPHGAFDTLFASQIYGIQTPGRWFMFAVIYLLLAGLVVGLFILQPIGFLIGFLIISMVHFSGDLAAGTPGWARLLYGGSIIVLPTLLHADEITRLFALLVGVEGASFVTPWLAMLAWPWTIGLALAAILRLSLDWLTALEMVAVGVLAVVAPPLVSFVVFFCAMHSARHVLRTIDYAGGSSPWLILGAALLPMLGVLIASAAAWEFLRDKPLDGRIIQLIFVGLAGLTVPHMALVERVRFSGWIRGAAPKRQRAKD